MIAYVVANIKSVLLTLVQAVVSIPALRQTVTTTYYREGAGKANARIKEHTQTQRKWISLPTAEEIMTNSAMSKYLRPLQTNTAGVHVRQKAGSEMIVTQWAG